MSAASSLRRARTAATLEDDHNIALIDQERPVQRASAEQSDSETATAPPTPGATPLVKKLTSNSAALQQSLKRELTKRKYAKYDRKRYDHGDVPEDAELDPASAPQQGEPASAAQAGYLERFSAKKNKLLKRRRTLGMGKTDQDVVIDVLYENQRGAFLFGIPKYSHASLFPRWDPRPWQNAQFRTSPVDIRNAQVPDPSWEWAWKSWYVDMSRDVDDEGWEYNFQFSGRGWHGNHPWFHSFARRRRWLRMRRRRDAGHKTKEKSHELTADYFTIHPKTLRPASEDFSRAASTDLARMEKQIEDEVEIEKMDITDVGSLDLALKKASIDREKLVAVRKFVDNGGDELYYLPERMPEIMNMLVFQSSRRQLLTDLLAHFDQARRRRESLQDHTHEDKQGQQEHDEAARQAENLMKAVQAADEEVKKLEYWSDIKGMAEGGKTLQDTYEGHWDTSKWQGLSPTDEQKHPVDAFANKQKASEGAPSLHAHAEHDSVSEKENKSSNVFYDARQTPKDASEADDYTTAGESASEVSKRRDRKGKSRLTSASSLDGVDESALHAVQPAVSESTREPDVPSKPKKQSVRVVEPVAVVDEAPPDSETLTQDAAAHQEYLRQEAKERQGRGGVTS